VQVPASPGRYINKRKISVIWGMQRFKRFLKIAFWSAGFMSLLLVLAILLSNLMVEKLSNKLIFSEAAGLPVSRVGLLLGTSKYNRNGEPNLYFRYRIEAAAELFKKGKVNYLIVSGDNRTLAYNEPRDMRKALIAKGVPDTAIYMDFAGLRTFDSVLRCREVFGQSSFIIISQRFHVQRALFIALQNKIPAVGYAARDVSGSYGWTVGLREMFARSKAVLDVFVLRTQPRFLGKPVKIGSQTGDLAMKQKSP
jgi:SanA protein